MTFTEIKARHQLQQMKDFSKEEQWVFIKSCYCAMFSYSTQLWSLEHYMQQYRFFLKRCSKNIWFYIIEGDLWKTSTHVCFCRFKKLKKLYILAFIRKIYMFIFLLNCITVKSTYLVNKRMGIFWPYVIITLAD